MAGVCPVHLGSDHRQQAHLTVSSLLVFAHAHDDTGIDAVPPWRRMQHCFTCDTPAFQVLRSVATVQDQTPMPLRIKALLASLPSSSYVGRRTVGPELAYKEATIARQEGPEEGVRHNRRLCRYRRGRQASSHCWGRLGRQVETALDWTVQCDFSICQQVQADRTPLSCTLYAGRFWCSKAPFFTRLLSDPARWSTKSRWALSWLANSTRPSCRGRSQRLLVSGESGMHATQSSVCTQPR